jgi:glyceraldehyde-3-phosphate dehydrogenase (NAD(P))
MGLQPQYDAQEALAQASVVVDCTADGQGRTHKQEWYNHLSTARGFVAQGSETGFGKPYAYSLNDDALIPGEDRFLQVVSCNTHNVAALLATLGLDQEEPDNLIEGHFLCLRRASDIGQRTSFVPAPDASQHKDERFGTHHAQDAWRLFQTLGYDLNIFSSAIKLNTQYMHGLWFNLRVKRAVTQDEVLDKLRTNPMVGLSEKTMASTIFSFGRDHGYFGRLFNQTVVSTPTIAVRDGHEIVGFCFTPQDGNSLLSSVAATAWLLNPENHHAHLQFAAPYLFDDL